MNRYRIDDIPPGSFFSKTAFLDGRFILAAPETPVDLELIKALKGWGYKELFSDGEPRESYAAAGMDIPDDPISQAVMSDHDKIKQAEAFYIGFQKYVDKLFIELSIKNALSFNMVAEKVKTACDIIREDRRFLMRVMKSTESKIDENYLSSHTVRSTILAMIIGFNLKLPVHRLIELGVAAVLHEIGMLKLPPQIYLAKRPLNTDERKALTTHPVFSYNTLKSLGFPVAVCVATLEHHERENGGGYPQKLTGDRISLYAKIIAVACSYEALSAKRPHKEAKDGYTGMLELLKNEGKQYDDTVVKALVYSLSIYPIGLYVMLNNGKKAQVVDVIPEEPRFPIVQLLGELTPDGKNKIQATSAGDVFIERPLTREEIGN